uniref:Uncharacterized protein n=1 Tax=Pygocentrus nattereri TaxID=42514 RepID=A0A3B4EGC6_PYGNA
MRELVSVSYFHPERFLSLFVLCVRMHSHTCVLSCLSISKRLRTLVHVCVCISVCMYSAVQKQHTTLNVLYFQSKQPLCYLSENRCNRHLHRSPHN